jgi:hypothetical protein
MCHAGLIIGHLLNDLGQQINFVVVKLTALARLQGRAPVMMSSPAAAWPPRQGKQVLRGLQGQMLTVWGL